MTASRVYFRIQRQKRKRLLLILTLLAVLTAVVIFVLTRVDGQRTPPVPAKTWAPVSSAVPSPALAEYQIRVRPGDTIGKILSRYGFSPADIQALYDQIKPVFDLRRIRAGRFLRLYADPSGAVVRLEYDVDDINYLSVEKREDLFRAALEARPVETEIGMVWGTIEDSPIQAFDRHGEEDSLALAFADLFGWDVDFYIDIRQGDTFKVIFEKRYLQGRFIGYGQILAAELLNQGKIHQAFYFASPPDTHKPGYYDAQGQSLEKEFRKSPIKWARITSRFSRSRLHPIHKVYRAHYGVDYAAQVGTPVQATADGVVSFAGWNGASGRMVRIRHKNAYETMYLHLRSFGPGIRSGARVKSGGIVGYVGSSGDSTGPHLDYRIKRNGSYLNPLSAKFDPVEPLKEELLGDFGKEIEKYRLLLAEPLVLVGSSFF
ncbi:MAG TPA: peptidoglycan DD-metalloendopeptidase family protein [Candidatus Desulfaltia sp.]|nr:peptidoglycan DD-metalloendopeptidase family protein [Candidatus Desulfaltia sp.]